MDWIKKHVDSAAVIGTLLTAVIWMRSEFKDIHNEMSILKNEISLVKTEMSIMKTVMIMKNIMPQELVIKEDK